MSEPQLALLAAQMPRLRAQRRLEEYDAGKAKLHPDTLWDLAFEATGSEVVANAYRCAAIKAGWRGKPDQS